MTFAPTALRRAVSCTALATVPAMLNAQTAPADAPLAVFDSQSTAPGPICTDRPTKSNAACTVPEGMVQVEADLFSWTRLKNGPARSDVLVYTSPLIKFGLGPDRDIQLGIAPQVEVRTRSNGQTVTQSGIGDLTLRYKQRITRANDEVQVALLPFIKAPTAARGVGNGEWEGGIIVPVQWTLGRGTLTMVPQLNLLAGSLAPNQRHLEFHGLVNLAYPVANRTVMAVEVWTSQNWDPAGTIRQYSADAALSHLLNDRLQFDIGGNIGLNRATPDLQLYAGVSARF